MRIDNKFKGLAKEDYRGDLLKIGEIPDGSEETMFVEFHLDTLNDYIKKEVEKAEGRGRTMAIHEISKTLDTEITRWRSDEDGEFDVLRIGFRYFRSTDVDDYSSSIEAISEEDFEDYESI